ncbi:MAG: putative Ribokinase [Parcubacteria group bacterium Gr01-1014_8]|nr:MAG: putative Ribokinase [Parcubacteria group bacterium Gr01-1014_8]
MQHDFLAIGDTTIDAFIRLKDARVHCDLNDEDCEICMRYGDKIPYEFVEVIPAVGNAANAAVSAARLGLNSALRAYVGDDADGAACYAALEKDKVDTSLMVKDPKNKTNYHYVLWYEVDRTILIKHEHYAYSFPALAEEPKWLYLSSMSEGDAAVTYHAEISKYLIEHPSVKLAFQPGTFQMRMGKEALKDIYARTEIFFCNKEEAQRILGSKSTDANELMQGIRALGPKIAVVTDGRKGSSIMTDDGAWHSPMYPDPKPPLQRTGAGDAAASTTVAYIILGLPPQEAMLRGLINSANVVQEIGAQRGLMPREKIEDWYAKRPADFAAVPL